MKNEILQQIKQIEKKEGIKVVFLIESGSRAWGWESEDSDYDVRGIFIQDYNTFQEEEKQLNYVIGNLDIELWDLKKFFRLFVESNPSTWEWLSSDIVYIKNNLFNDLKKAFEKRFNKQKLQKHYLSMARQNFEKYINNSGDKANLKKYVYVLRSIACINFIEKETLPPPKNYKEIINYLPKVVNSFFNKIVEDKKNSESLEGNRNKEVEKYVTSFWKREFKEDTDKFEINKLENMFKKIINKGSLIKE